MQIISVRRFFKINFLKVIKYKPHPDVEYIMKTKPILND